LASVSEASVPQGLLFCFWAHNELERSIMVERAWRSKISHHMVALEVKSENVLTALPLR
jgi:hypothetical protein